MKSKFSRWKIIIILVFIYHRREKKGPSLTKPSSHPWFFAIPSRDKQKVIARKNFAAWGSKVNDAEWKSRASTREALTKRSSYFGSSEIPQSPSVYRVGIADNDTRLANHERMPRGDAHRSTHVLNPAAGTLKLDAFNRAANKSTFRAPRSRPKRKPISQCQVTRQRDFNSVINSCRHTSSDYDIACRVS